jgi:hypothetical protein
MNISNVSLIPMTIICNMTQIIFAPNISLLIQSSFFVLSCTFQMYPSSKEQGPNPKGQNVFVA